MSEQIVFDPSSESALGSRVEPLVETIEHLRNIVVAGVRACEWLGLNPNNRHDKKIIEGWTLLKGRLHAGEDRTVGIVSKINDGETQAYCVIRLDWDKKKGLHFNAILPYDNDQKLAACSDIPALEDDFVRQLNAIEGLDPQEIWTRWRTGKWL